MAREELYPMPIPPVAVMTPVTLLVVVVMAVVVVGGTPTFTSLECVLVRLVFVSCNSSTCLLPASISE